MNTERKVEKGTLKLSESRRKEEVSRNDDVRIREWIQSELWYSVPTQRESDGQTLVQWVGARPMLSEPSHQPPSFPHWRKGRGGELQREDNPATPPVSLESDPVVWWVVIGWFPRLHVWSHSCSNRMRVVGPPLNPQISFSFPFREPRVWLILCHVSN